MKTINTIDLWTEQHDNRYECFNGNVCKIYVENISHYLLNGKIIELLNSLKIK